MSDMKEQRLTRQQVALTLIRALELKDNETVSRLRSENCYITVMPYGGPNWLSPDDSEKPWLVTSQFTEIKAFPLDVMETLDGRVIMQLRWTALRNDGRWIQKEEMRIFSFEDRGPFEDPLIVEEKAFVDWVGAIHWGWPKWTSNRATSGQIYETLMRKDQSYESGGKCHIM